MRRIPSTIVVSLSLAILGTVTLSLLFRTRLPWFGCLVAICGVAAWYLLASHFRAQLEEPARSHFLVGLLTAFTISRIVWIALVPTLPVSDFAAFDKLAHSISVGEPIQGVVINPLGYPALLGSLYAVFGETLFVAKISNLILGALSLLLLYYFASSFASEAVARLTALLFLIWPAQLAFTSVLASEHLALPFLLGAFCVLAKHQASSKLRIPLWAGTLIGLAYVTRPFMIIAIIAALGFLTQSKQTRRLLRMGSLIVGFLCATLLFDSAMTHFYRIHNLGFPYHVLLTGTNFESEGRYNDLDTTTFWSFSNLDEAKQYALQESIRRVTSRPAGFVVLIFKKIVHLWEDDSYGVYWSTYKVSDDGYGSWIATYQPYLHTICHIFFLFVMILATMGCYTTWRDDRRRPQEFLILLLIIGGAGVVAIMETQARYHYVLMPAVLLFGARAIEHRGKEAQRRESVLIV